MESRDDLCLLVTTKQSLLLMPLVTKLGEKRVRTIVTEATTGAIRGTNEKPGVILLYIDHDQIDHEVIRLLHDYSLEGVPTYLIGEEVDIKSLQRSFSHKVADYIFYRPFDAEKVAEHIKETLAQKDQMISNLGGLLAQSKEQNQRKHILVVDDSVDVLKRMKELLSENYDVTVVKSGDMCFRFLATKIPDLILLDYEMPGMNGTEVISTLRSNPQYMSIPVFFLTSSSDRATVLEIVRQSPEGYLLKSMDPKAILDRLDMFFGMQL